MEKVQSKPPLSTTRARVTSRGVLRSHKMPNQKHLMEDVSIEPPELIVNTEKQEELRMQIRMHIIEESKAEYNEMPQDWVPCQIQKGEKCCMKCGTLVDTEMREAIKEPRFMKNTNHLEPMQLFKQMCLDQKTITQKMTDMYQSTEGSTHDSLNSERSRGSINSLEIYSSPIKGEFYNEKQNRNYSKSDLDFIQNSIREQAIIKILESGVRLCLKLQTSHIASMYFETWLDKKKRENEWFEEMKSLSDKEMRQYLDLVTLTCVLLASKTNEQNCHQPSIHDIQRLIRSRYSYEDFVEMERYLIIDCLDWNLNVTTPYHFSDCIQGMGCLFWSDFPDELVGDFKNDPTKQEQLVIILIQLRKYINYFVEQSLINGMWGNFPHDIIALASILIARYEMQQIDQIKWKRKNLDKSVLKINKTRNENLAAFKNLNGNALQACILEIYKTVFDGAIFPYQQEIYRKKKEPPQILIQETNQAFDKENNRNYMNIRGLSDSRNQNLKIQNLQLSNITQQTGAGSSYATSRVTTRTAFMGQRQRYGPSNGNVSQNSSRVARESTHDSKFQHNVNLDQCLQNQIAHINDYQFFESRKIPKQHQTGGESQRDNLLKQIHQKKSKSHHYIKKLIENGHHTQRKANEISLPSLGVPQWNKQQVLSNLQTSQSNMLFQKSSTYISKPKFLKRQEQSRKIYTAAISTQASSGCLKTSESANFYTGPQLSKKGKSIDKSGVTKSVLSPQDINVNVTKKASMMTEFELRQEAVFSHRNKRYKSFNRK